MFRVMCEDLTKELPPVLGSVLCFSGGDVPPDVSNSAYLRLKWGCLQSLSV